LSIHIYIETHTGNKQTQTHLFRLALSNSCHTRRAAIKTFPWFVSRALTLHYWRARRGGLNSNVAKWKDVIWTQKIHDATGWQKISNFFFLV